MSNTIDKSRLKWFGHLNRMESNMIKKYILEWNGEGRERKGEPREQPVDNIRRNTSAKISRKEMQKTDNSGGANYFWVERYLMHYKKITQLQTLYYYYLRRVV